MYFAGVRYASRVEDERLAREEYLRKETEWRVLSLKLRSAAENFRGTAGILIKDLEYGFEFRHNEDELFASASLAKVPIMVAAFKASNEGLLDLDKEMALTRRDVLPGSGNLRFMSPGTEFTLRELVDLMVSISDNTATNMVTRAVGMDYINRAIAEIGMENSILSRRVADYDARSRGLENYTTAREMSVIFEDMYRGTLVNQDVSAKSLRYLFDQRSRDRIPGRLPGDVPVAHKTGLERGVCHDAGIVFDPRGHYLIAVLTRHSNPNSVPSKNFIADISLMVYERHNMGAGGEAALRGSRRVTLSPEEVQRFLFEKGFYEGNIDGIIGPRTRSAVRRFQEFSGLTPDGIVGPKTTGAMFEYSAAAGKDMFRE